MTVTNWRCFWCKAENVGDLPNECSHCTVKLKDFISLELTWGELRKRFRRENGFDPVDLSSWAQHWRDSDYVRNDLYSQTMRDIYVELDRDILKSLTDKLDSMGK